MTKKKPLQVLFTEKEKKELEAVRKKSGLRSWGATVRFLIKRAKRR